MIDSVKEYNERYDNINLDTPGDSNEVVIIIRDGKVVTFIQKNKNVPLEGLYGDGI